MKTDTEVKELVRQKYSKIAEQDKVMNASSCCGSGASSTEVCNIMNDDYAQAAGYNAEADLGLGCGLPVEHTFINSGDTVVDLGSGAGNDCFVARAYTGPAGRVIGIDFTPAMIEKARKNAEKSGYENVEFIEGDIENIPLGGASVDVVVSNCVLNLVPDKSNVYDEIFRILKPEGHFSISDVVLVGELPEALKKNAEMYAGCISGAIQKDTYLEIIENSGFVNIQIKSEKAIGIPEDILKQYLNEQELREFKEGKTGIYSITVYGEKAAGCCGGGCCNT